MGALTVFRGRSGGHVNGLGVLTCICAIEAASKVADLALEERGTPDLVFVLEEVYAMY